MGWYDAKGARCPANPRCGASQSRPNVVRRDSGASAAALSRAALAGAFLLFFRTFGLKIAFQHGAQFCAVQVAGNVAVKQKLIVPRSSLTITTTASFLR